MGTGPTKYAVQRPKGTKWETLALVDDPVAAQQEYREMIRRHGATFVRLIQVRFRTGDVLADYDWELLELHDPLNRTDRPNLKVVASNRRAGTKWQPGKKDAPPARRRRPGEKVPIPFSMYVAAFILGGLTIILWHLWFRV